MKDVWVVNLNESGGSVTAGPSGRKPGLVNRQFAKNIFKSGSTPAIYAAESPPLSQGLI